MTFKDQVMADLNVFLNTDEFAEIHAIELEGVRYEIPSLIGKDASVAYGKQWEGTYQSDLTIMFKASAITRRPVKGQEIIFDGKWYMIAECKNDMGMLVLSLEVPEG